MRALESIQDQAYATLGGGPELKNINTSPHEGGG